METMDTLPHQVSDAILDSCLAPTSMAAGSGKATIRQGHQDEDRDEHHHRHHRKRSCKEIGALMGTMRRVAGELGQRLTVEELEEMIDEADREVEMLEEMINASEFLRIKAKR